MTAAIPAMSGDLAASAWFICRAGAITDDVLIRVKDRSATDEQLAADGRMRAARIFKKRHGLHPCTRIDVEYQGVEVHGNDR